MLTNQNFVKVFFLETHVERISNLQEIKKAELDRETGLFLYEDMTLGRRFEDKCQKCITGEKCLVSFIYITDRKLLVPE